MTCTSAPATRARCNCTATSCTTSGSTLAHATHAVATSATRTGRKRANHRRVQSALEPEQAPEVKGQTRRQLRQRLRNGGGARSPCAWCARRRLRPHPPCQDALDRRRAVLQRRTATTYCNDGDWVESLTALVEHADGRLEIIDWTARRAGAIASRPAALQPALS